MLIGSSLRSTIAFMAGPLRAWASERGWGESMVYGYWEGYSDALTDLSRCCYPDIAQKPDHAKANRPDIVKFIEEQNKL